jgi:hypothetical protein
MPQDRDALCPSENPSRLQSPAAERPIGARDEFHLVAVPDQKTVASPTRKAGPGSSRADLDDSVQRRGSATKVLAGEFFSTISRERLWRASAATTASSCKANKLRELKIARGSRMRCDGFGPNTSVSRHTSPAGTYYARRALYLLAYCCRPSMARASSGEAGSIFSSLMMRTVRATSCSLVARTPWL